MSHAAGFRARLGDDARWLGVMAIVTAIELAWWAAAWSAGIAPLPWPATYLVLAGAGLAAALVVRRVMRPRTPRAAWPTLLAGAALVGLGASLFLPLKFAIPGEIAFWLDAPIVAAERSLFGIDPWLALDHYLGWATLPLDRLYASWLPTQTLVLFMVMLEPPSRAKSRALIAYVLGWFVLGVIAAVLCSSAGPIFYDRLFWGSDFAALGATLRARGASFALAESDAMWASLASGRPGLVAGISALPSIHVAISLWLYLAARTMAPRWALAALVYFVLIWLGSVQLGWHYVADGLAGALGMVAIWAIARRFDAPRALVRGA